MLKATLRRVDAHAVNTWSQLSIRKAADLQCWVAELDGEEYVLEPIAAWRARQQEPAALPPAAIAPFEDLYAELVSRHPDDMAFEHLVVRHLAR